MGQSHSFRVPSGPACELNIGDIFKRNGGFAGAHFLRRALLPQELTPSQHAELFLVREQDDVLQVWEPY